MSSQVRTGAGDSGASVLAAKIFTIFEGTSEIQRMIIGRAVTGLDVR
jgi:alkylation response protein AidB-like acyl-CoA dehydrogenase